MDDITVLSEIVWRGVQQWGDRVALEDARSSRRLTYRSLYVRMQSAASALRARGYRRGSRVVLRMDGSADWAIAFLGVLHADLVAVPLPAATPGAVRDRSGPPRAGDRCSDGGRRR
jgi:acyl-CoA synthetase (AMP-forming)/AMP-acid ligase II